MNKLGIIDWGIGGVSIYKLLRERGERCSVAYFSDTGVTPYGKMARRELASRLDQVIEFLRRNGVTHIVIGCNAASTAIGDLSDHGVPILGVIEPAVALTAKLRPERLGLIGGRRTVLSGIYRRAFRDLGIAVTQRIAQPLSGLIESGDTGSEALIAEAARIVGPLRRSSHILLACTHYPAIAEVLSGLVSPQTKLIDPADELAKLVSRWHLTQGGVEVFYCSGDAAAMRSAAEAAFGIRLENVQSVSP